MAQSNVDATNKFAWTENTGWLNFRDANGGASGVRVGETFLAGFAWGENIGWINLDLAAAGQFVGIDLGPTCLADIAGGGADGLSPDGTIDGTDFIAFINSFGIGDATVDPLADVAGAGDDGLQPDGTIDGSDFIAFINAFAAGC